MHMRSIYRDGYVCTAYLPSTRGVGFPGANVLKVVGYQGAPPDIAYDGSEGELYDLSEDPRQWRNLWNEPGYRARRKDLVADLLDHLPPRREPPLPVEAPT
jgi:hypothetical protein